MGMLEKICLAIGLSLAAGCTTVVSNELYASVYSSEGPQFRKVGERGTEKDGRQYVLVNYPFEQGTFSPTPGDYFPVIAQTDEGYQTIGWVPKKLEKIEPKKCYLTPEKDEVPIWKRKARPGDASLMEKLGDD